MSVKSCEKLDKSKVALTIEADAAAFEAAINKAYFMELVSRRTVASVDRHMGANTYHTSSDSPVASDHCAPMMAPSASAASSPPDKA